MIKNKFSGYLPSGGWRKLSAANLNCAGVDFNGRIKIKFGGEMKKISMLLLLLLVAAGCAAVGNNARLVMQDQYLQGKQAYEQRDYEKALYLLKPAALAGNPNAQYYLAILYDFGRGAPANHEQANQWYLKAAEHGQSDAQYNLALSYYRGEGVERNYNMAVYWLAKAAANGDTAAVDMLMDYAESSAHPEAQYALAQLFRNGVALHNDLELYPNERGNAPMSPDLERYRYWLQRAADNGHQEAREELSE